MMPNENKSLDWERAIMRLVELTREAKISWKPWQFGPRPNVGRFVGVPLVARVNDRNVLIYQYVVPDVDDSGNHFYSEHVAIEFVDAEGRTEWVWPASKGRWELLEAARFSHASPDAFLEALLP